MNPSTYRFKTADVAKHVARTLRDNGAIHLRSISRRGSLVTIDDSTSDDFDRGYALGVVHGANGKEVFR